MFPRLAPGWIKHAYLLEPGYQADPGTFGAERELETIEVTWKFSFAMLSNSFTMSSITNGLGTSVRKAVGPKAKVTVVLGAQWGNEGKGKLVDILATDADLVCRCQVIKICVFWLMCL